MRRQFLQMIVVVLLIGLALIMAVTFQASAKRSALRVSCASNLKQIGTAMTMYADNSGNKMFPTHGTVADPFSETASIDSLISLYRGYVQDPKVFSCPGDPVVPKTYSELLEPGTVRHSSKDASSYGYDPGHNMGTPDVAIAADRKPVGNEIENHGGEGQNVLQASGTVFFSSTSENFATDNSGNKILIDDDIYKLNPAQKRELDSYIRQ